MALRVYLPCICHGLNKQDQGIQHMAYILVHNDCQGNKFLTDRCKTIDKYPGQHFDAHSTTPLTSVHVLMQGRDTETTKVHVTTHILVPVP